MKNVYRLLIVVLVVAFALPLSVASAQETGPATLIISAGSGTLVEAGDAYTLTLNDVDAAVLVELSSGVVVREDFYVFAGAWDQMDAPLSAVLTIDGFTLAVTLSDPVYDSEANSFVAVADVTDIFAFDEAFNPAKDPLPAEFDSPALFVSADEELMGLMGAAAESSGVRADGTAFLQCYVNLTSATCSTTSGCYWASFMGSQWCMNK